MKHKFRSGLSLLLSVLMIMLSVTVYMEDITYAATYRNGAQSGPSTSYKNGKYYKHYTQVPITGDNRTDLIAMALSQLGYQEGAANGNFSGEVSGRYNYVEFSYNMGDLGLGYGGSDYPWCASFVSWCLYQSHCTNQATYSSLGRFHNGDYAYIWKEISCSQWVRQLKGAGYYKYSKYEGGTYTPKSGDLVFFQNSGGVAHIGICLYTSGGRIYTVEGNTSDSSGLEANGGGVYFKNYSLSSSYLNGYGVLPYKSNSAVAKIDYSGNNPTPGLYVANAGKYVYSTVDATSHSSVLPRFSMFEVTEVCSNGRLRIKYGNTVGYIKNNSDRVIQLSTTAGVTVDPTTDERTTLKSLIAKAESARHYNYSEAAIANIRPAYTAAVAALADTSATTETETKLKNAITALQSALNNTGSNTLAFNNEGVYITGLNKVIKAGDCVMYSNDYNGNGLITVDNANIRYTVNVVFEWDSDQCINVVKSISYGTGNSTPSIQLKEGQFLLAAHEWENGVSSSDNPVKYSGTNYRILSELEIGAGIKLSGASLYPLNYTIASTGVEPCAYAKFINPEAVAMNNRNTTVKEGDFTLFTPDYYGGTLTADNANVDDTLNIIGEWSEPDQAWIVANKYVGLPSGSSNIVITGGQIVISGLAVTGAADIGDGTQENYEKLNSAQIGDKIVFSGISPTSGTTVSIAANVDFVNLSVDEGEEGGEVVGPVNLALNKTYKANETTTAHTAELTDGLKATGLSDGSWFGFKNATDGNTDPNGVGTIVVDLETKSTIDDIKMHIYAGENAASIAQPSYVNVYVSSNGKDYAQVGTLGLDSSATAAYWAELNDVAMMGRYVKFEVGPSGVSTWVFVNEIEIYGEAGSEENKITTESEYESTTESNEGNIVIDLNARYDISSISAVVEANDAASAKLNVSLDGSNYIKVSDVDLTWLENGKYQVEVDNLKVTGRYIKLEMQTSSATIKISDVKVCGTEYIQSESDNIALGCDYTAPAVVGKDFTASLTDGVASQVFQNGLNDSSWYGFHNTGNADTSNTTSTGKGIVIIDLGGQSEITGTSAHMLAGLNDLGAQPPAVNVYYSNDGTDYIYFGTMNYKDETAPYWSAFSFAPAITEKKVYGRYVKYAFLMSPENAEPIEWSLVNEIQVYGTRITSDEIVEPDSNAFVTLSGTFNGWNATPNMKTTSDENVVRGELVLDEGSYEFKILYGNEWYGNQVTITDATSNDGVQLGKEGNNCTLDATKSGKYIFKFNKSTHKLNIYYGTDEKIDAAKPIIKANPKSATYEYNAKTTAMTVDASVTDGGTLTYQWYKNRNKSTTGATLIKNATDKTLRPDTTSVGTYYYYCVVTNTNKNATGVTSATSTTGFAQIVTTQAANQITDVKSTYNKTLATKSFRIVPVAKGTITYKTSDPKVVTVNANGIITIKGAGTAYITITAGNANYMTVTKKAKVVVTKRANRITGVKAGYVKNSTVKTFKLAPKANGTIKYKTSNAKTATVNAKGVVTIKGVGSAFITITAGNANYKTVTKKIKLTVVPKKTKLSSVKSNSKKALTIKWKKNSEATGYKIQYSTRASFASKYTKTKTVNKSTLSRTIKNLKAGKKYYVRVRAYKKVGSYNYMGVWSAVKKCTTRK